MINWYTFKIFKSSKFSFSTMFRMYRMLLWYPLTHTTFNLLFKLNIKIQSSTFECIFILEWKIINGKVCTKWNKNYQSVHPCNKLFICCLTFWSGLFWFLLDNLIYTSASICIFGPKIFLAKNYQIHSQIFSQWDFNTTLRGAITLLAVRPMAVPA